MKVLPTQVIWNFIPFGFLRGVGSYLPVQDFSFKSAVKIEADEETGLAKITGRELQECSFSVRAMDADIVDSSLSANPRLVFEMLTALKGSKAPIYLSAGMESSLAISLLDALQTSDWKKLFSVDGAIDLAKSLLFGTQLGNCDFMLTKVDMDADGIYPNGEIYAATITLSFTEAEPQKQFGGLVVEVNGKDITNSISLHSAIYESFAETSADVLTLEFADTEKQWSKWKPSPEGDTIRVTDGPLDTGKMFIDTVDPNNGKYKLTASSAPKTARSVKSRSFSSLSLPQLAQKIAGEHKLTYQGYDVPEVATPYTSQQSLTDLAFLALQCDRLGAAFVIYDGKLNVYSQRAMEAKSPTKELKPGARDIASVINDPHSAYAGAELFNGKLTGSASDPSVATGKIFRESTTQAWASQAAANMAAAAKLRQLNKSCSRAEVDMPTQRQLAAGSVVSLSCSGWSGSAFVYHIRHDLGTKRSKIWLRKPLSY